ncbi:hypothetical protein [Limnohabitans sp. Jir72]|uniref:hypothetical protein n=1 Tax=Limnohabitans sp. Jir72 TaxID=1977909 RepID=UPI0011B1F1A8|nr:hypothetical protein [Limnohabitans sp. Jir72]
MTPGYYSQSLDGHRAAYLDFVVKRFGGERIQVGDLFRRSSVVMFLMIEENFVLYVLSAFWRSILGRRTVGLLFRPGPTVQRKTLKHLFKWLLLRILKLLPEVHTLSIVPINFDERISLIVDNWIHDFQLWDISENEIILFNNIKNQYESDRFAENFTLFEKAKKHANGRPLLVALGMQTRNKGTEILARYISNDVKRGWTVLVAGRFASDQQQSRQLIEACGGLVIDKYLSDIEMIEVYAAADAVWCLYDPAYDQASGILGRAIQLGVPTVVRDGSYSAKLCENEKINHILIRKEMNLNIMKEKSNINNFDEIKKKTSNRGVRSAECLRKALNIENLDIQ